jgi:hypothetical protein
MRRPRSAGSFPRAGRHHGSAALSRHYDPGLVPALDAGSSCTGAGRLSPRRLYSLLAAGGGRGRASWDGSPPGFGRFDGISLLRREGGGGAWLPEGRVEASAYGLEGIRVEGAFHRFASQWLLLFTARGPDGGRGLWALVDPGRGNPASVMSLCGGRAGAGDPSWTAVRAEGGRAVFVSAAEGSLEALILGPAPSWTARRATEPAIPSARVLDAFSLRGYAAVAVLGGERSSELLLLDLAADQPRWERVAADAAVSRMASWAERSAGPGSLGLRKRTMRAVHLVGMGRRLEGWQGLGRASGPGPPSPRIDEGFA